VTGADTTLPLFAIVFWGILTFSLIVVVHEAGHFVMARLFGVKVHEFVIGLPGPTLRWHTRITTFGVSAIPLGGYVRIAGMEPGEEDPLLRRALLIVASRRETDVATLASALEVGIGRSRALLGTLVDWGSIEALDEEQSVYAPTVVPRADETDDSFYDRVRDATFKGKKVWQRIAILGMGVVLNLLFAIVTFSVVLSVWGYFEATTTVDPLPDTPAEQVGVEPGDTILAIDGEAVDEWADVLRLLSAAEPDEPIELLVDGPSGSRTLTPVLAESEGRAYLGVETRMENVTLPFFSAVRESVRWTGMVFEALGNLFRPDRFQETIQDARGVVGVSVEAAEAAQRGPVDYAWMLALLSLSLGALNIFPIPPLDGGKIVLEIVEGVTGRAVPRQWYIALTALGALLILSLLAYLVYADTIRYVLS
jgi:regulator of sigma E protease